ncbi:hypothetical protein KKE07_05095, partial [Candidatus Dependentiae bacterium]|nr:hypothetical protein [Candidatus Dependentiae bacterium]
GEQIWIQTLVRPVDDKWKEIGEKTRDSGTGNNLRILGFDGSSLNLLSSLLFANDVNTVAWHPSQYYLAIGIQAAITGFEVRIYSWNGTTLSQTSGAEIGTGVRAVAWSRDGNYLAISQSNDYVRVYSFSAGTITLQASLLLTGFGTAARDAISWDSTGQYIVVGDGSTATNSLRVLYYNGATSLTQNVAVSPGSVIQTVDWRPNSDLIAVGLSATTERLRLYRFASGSLTDVTSAYVGEIYTIYSVNWSNNGNYLVSGRDDQAGNDLKTYYFNSYNNQLLLLAGFEVPSDVYCAKWAHGENYLATGDQGDYVRVYGITKRDLDFYDTDLILNSDLNIKMTANFFNSCSINGNGNRINLDTSGIINIGAGSSLTIKNAEIYGLSKQNLKCLSDNSSLIVQNCVLTLTSNYLFDQGSILFDKDVIISGTNFFTYASRQTSTINSDSRLYLSQNLTFSYAPKRNNKDLIYMTDVSSGLYLDGTTLLSTNTGLRLSAGSLFLDNKVTISALGIALSESIVFNSDLTLNILASANLDLYGPIEI